MSIRRRLLFTVSSAIALGYLPSKDIEMLAQFAAKKAANADADNNEQNGLLRIFSGLKLTINGSMKAL